MNFEKLAPWNWFKKEDEQKTEIIPVRHDVENEFNRFFDLMRQSFERGWPSGLVSDTDWLRPSLDIASDDKEYSVKVELPGIDAADISIEYTDNTLKIKGEKRQEKEEKEKDFYRIERSYGSFQRILDIPEDADTERITSSYKDGVLTVTIPRKELPKKDTKKIEVEVK